MPFAGSQINDPQRRGEAVVALASFGMDRVSKITLQFFDPTNGWRPISHNVLFALSDEEVSRLVGKLVFNGHIVFDELDEQEMIQLFEKWASNPCEETRSYIASIVVNLSCGMFSWADGIFDRLSHAMNDPMLLESIREYRRIHSRAVEDRRRRQSLDNGNSDVDLEDS